MTSPGSPAHFETTQKIWSGTLQWSYVEEKDGAWCQPPTYFFGDWRLILR